MLQHTTVNRQTDNKTGNNRRVTFTSITMDNVICEDWVTGGKVWGCTGIVTKVNRGIRYNDESRRAGRSDDLERSGLLWRTGMVDAGRWRNQRFGAWNEVCCADRTAAFPRLNLPRQTE